MNSNLTLASLLLLISLSSCSGCKEIEHSEGVVADIEAAQMEGRKAARKFVVSSWKDTAELRREKKAADMLRDSIVSPRGQKAREAYDSTFISTIRAVRPTLADSIAGLDAKTE